MDGFSLAHQISRKQGRLLDCLRDRRTDSAAALPGTADSFEALIGEEFALLVTFRRSGERQLPARDPALQFLLAAEPALPTIDNAADVSSLAGCPPFARRCLAIPYDVRTVAIGAYGWLSLSRVISAAPATGLPAR